MSIAFDCAVECYLTSVIHVCFGYKFIILNKSKSFTANTTETVELIGGT